jgi:hypothetical protein
MVEALRLENDPNVKTYSLEDALKELKSWTKKSFGPVNLKKIIN